jgi:hypothetical protein
MIPAGQTLQLHRARIVGPGASRNLLSVALAQVPLAPLGLAEDELLLIHHHSSRALLRFGADGGVQPGFARTLGAELAAALATAAINPLPGTRAAAYRFTTSSSFAFWLLGNWAMGGAAHQAAAAMAALPAGGSAISWARSQLFDNGRSLPGVFAALAQMGLAAAVFSRLDPADLVQMRRALLQSHGLPLPEAMAQVWPVAGSEMAGAYAPATAGNGPPPEARTSVRAVASTAAAARVAGNDLASLPAAAIALLLALLHLQADPATPRAALAAAVASIASAASVFTRVEDDEAESTPAPRPERIPHSSDHPHSPPSPFPPLPPSSPSPAVRPGEPNLPFATAPQPSAPPTPAPPSQPRADSTIAVPLAGFASDFAGLLFLFNAFLAMGLYPDFTNSSDAALALAPTRLLDRLALHWFGSRYGGDHLHKALASDAADPPLPDRWQVEPAWLEAFAGEEGTERVTSQRHKTLWHPAGFPLADSPLPGRKGWRAGGRRKDRRQRPSAALSQSGRQLPSAQPARWLACLALYLDARIQRATDDPELGLSSLAIPGHCRIGADRIDIDLALADLPLPLRLAGLDRDPGWLPPEGRAIAFHFG